jgi:hypothetical protein
MHVRACMCEVGIYHIRHRVHFILASCSSQQFFLFSCACVSFAFVSLYYLLLPLTKLGVAASSTYS